MQKCNKFRVLKLLKSISSWRRIAVWAFALCRLAAVFCLRYIGKVSKLLTSDSIAAGLQRCSYQLLRVTRGSVSV